MKVTAREIEFPLVELNHCSTDEHCKSLRRSRSMPFWWYQDVSPIRTNFSKPFQDNHGHWWYQVKPGFAWPVDALHSIPSDDLRVPFVHSYLGYQHVVPKDEQANSALVINTILDLPGFGPHSINDKRRNAIRKGHRCCEIVDLRQVEDRWLDGAVKSWNDLVDRSGWKYHRDAHTIRSTWTQLLKLPAATILLAIDKATGQVAGFLITKIYGQVAYVDTIASNSDLLASNPNDILMYTFIRNAQRIPGVQMVHFAIKSEVEPLERFKTSIGFEPFPFPALLRTRPGMMTGLRVFLPGTFNRLTGRLGRPGEHVAPSSGLSDPVMQEAESVSRCWFVPPKQTLRPSWMVYSLDFVLATLQGSITEPDQVRRTPMWRTVGLVVWTFMALLQIIIMGLAWIPIVSWILESVSRTATRNAVGFFLRSCYWKSRLQSLGIDTIIDQGVEIWGPANVSIGSHCHIDTNVRLAAGERYHRQRGSIRIGDYVHLGPGVHVAGRGGVEIGDLVSISAEAHLYSASNTIEFPDDPGRLISMSHMAPRDQQHTIERPIVIEEYAFIGMMTRILPGVRVGRGAVVHANCELTRDIPSFANIGGVARGRQIGWRRPRRPRSHAKAKPPDKSADASETSAASAEND